jgi:hypothetical protein
MEGTTRSSHIQRRKKSQWGRGLGPVSSGCRCGSSGLEAEGQELGAAGGVAIDKGAKADLVSNA